MTTSRVCIYRYDALDVLVDVETVGGEKRQRFYRREQLVTELERLSSQSVFQHGKPLLALQSRQGNELASALLTSDQQGSVLQVTESGGSVFQVYTPYGHRRVESGLGSLLGFAGEAVDPGTGRYLLGNGRRVFNPVLMRFNSPDRLSPFGRGGLNPYAYCLGDPVNFSDPSGEFAAIARILTSMGGLFNSVISLRPGVPFQVALDALANGAVFRLPLRHSVGAVSAVVAGVTGVAGAALGLANTVVAAVNPASTLLGPAANTALGLAGGSVAGRLGSWWAARDPAVVPALKALANGSSAAVRPVASAGSRRTSFSAIEMEFRPSAPPPDALQASTPPRTPGQISIEMFNLNQPASRSAASSSGSYIRRRFSQ